MYYVLRLAPNLYWRTATKSVKTKRSASVLTYDEARALQATNPGSVIEPAVRWRDA